MIETKKSAVGEWITWRMLLLKLYQERGRCCCDARGAIPSRGKNRDRFRVLASGGGDTGRESLGGWAETGPAQQATRHKNRRTTRGTARCESRELEKRCVTACGFVCDG